MLPDIPQLVFLGMLGLVFGSFLTSLTWRITKKNFQSRSICPHCKKTIRWYDNIPLLSYLILSGRCRSCKKRISMRYPLIELGTAAVFVILGWASMTNASIIMIKWGEWLNGFTLPVFLGAAIILIAIFVVDIEHQIIPDFLVSIVAIVFLILLVGASTKMLSTHLMWASLGASFVLGLNIITLGRGMGLGDVKLMAVLGLFIGDMLPMVFFIGVLIGAVVGIIMIVAKKAKFGKPIPFGPFLILGTLVVLLFEDKIWEILAYGV